MVKAKLSPKLATCKSRYLLTCKTKSKLFRLHWGGTDVFPLSSDYSAYKVKDKAIEIKSQCENAGDIL